MKVMATFNGTGAGVYLCLGFLPDAGELRAIEDADEAFVVYSKGMRGAEQSDGVYYVGSSGALQTAAATAGTYLQPYYGNDLLTAALQTSVGYGEGVYLGWDQTGDYKANATYGYATVPLTTWTLGSAANRTGNANGDSISSGNRIGEGSRITIRETSTGLVKTATVESWTAGQGVSANEITLSVAIQSGTIQRISGMYDLIPIAVGKVTPAGYYCAGSTGVNVNDEIQMIVAESYDFAIA